MKSFLLKKNKKAKSICHLFRARIIRRDFQANRISVAYNITKFTLILVFVFGLIIGFDTRIKAEVASGYFNNATFEANILKTFGKTKDVLSNELTSKKNLNTLNSKIDELAVVNKESNNINKQSQTLTQNQPTEIIRETRVIEKADPQALANLEEKMMNLQNQYEQYKQINDDQFQNTQRVMAEISQGTSLAPRGSIPLTIYSPTFSGDVSGLDDGDIPNDITISSSNNLSAVAGTFSGSLTITGTATSTFANGIQLSAGCFLMPDGQCAGAGGGASTYLTLTDTPSSFTASAIPYTNTGATALLHSSSLVFDGTNLGVTGDIYILGSDINIGNGKVATSTIHAQYGKLGFGTTSPYAQVAIESVQGIVGSSTPIFVIGDSGTSTPSLLVDWRGRVGIGTSTPGTRFAVEGLANFGSLVVEGTSRVSSLISTSTALSGFGTSTPWGTLAIEQIDSGSENLPAFVVGDQGSNTPSFVILNGTGRVGIATDTPSLTLSIGGNILVGGTATNSFDNGIKLKAGCFQMPNGTCISGAEVSTTGGEYSNLVIENDATNSNYQLDITADAVVVQGVRLESVSIGADITVSGAGGLQSGSSEAADTWYKIYLMTNADGSSVAGMFVPEGTSLVIPSPYTKARRIGYVRNDASSNFLAFVQEGKFLTYNASYFTLAAGTATSYTAVSNTSYIPPTSRKGYFRLATIAKHSVVNTNFNTFLRPTGSTAGSVLTFNLLNYDTLYFHNADIFGFVTTNASQQVDYYMVNAPNTSGGVYIAVLGYYDRI